MYIVAIAACMTAFLYAPTEITHLINGTDEDALREEMRQEFRQRKAAQLTQLPKDSIRLNDNDPNRPKRLLKGGLRYFPGSYAIFILVLAVGTSIALMQQWLTTERTKELVEHERANTELSFLRSQVNPHFFFNTLNNIYSLAVVQSDQTAPAVMKLSAIMRYILTETQTDSVPLENEIGFIKNFIDLQLVRLTDKVTVHFTTEGDAQQKQIAPLLLIPFVENAFKYGVSTKEKSAITISLKADETRIVFSVVNTIVKVDTGIHDTTGIGINNAKRRLELLYPFKHTLNVTEENNQFKVQLVITT